MPRYEKKPADQSQMLEERVLQHNTFRKPYLPTAIRDESRHQREACERKSSRPAEETGEDRGRRAEFEHDDSDRKRRGRRETEMVHLGDSAVKVRGLVEAAL